MNFSKIVPISIAATIALFASNPAFAKACSTSYEVSPVQSYSGPINASRNLLLYPNSYILSPSGNYKLIWQADGNLVLYNASGVARWESDTQNCNPTANVVRYTAFQTDGNLVEYYSVRNTGQIFAAWSSDTNGHPNAFLNVQDDGNVVIYDGTKVLWSIF